jgi:hypothetical protein
MAAPEDFRGNKRSFCCLLHLGIRFGPTPGQDNENILPKFVVEDLALALHFCLAWPTFAGRGATSTRVYLRAFYELFRKHLEWTYFGFCEQEIRCRKGTLHEPLCNTTYNNRKELATPNRRASLF